MKVNLWNPCPEIQITPNPAPISVPKYFPSVRRFGGFADSYLAPMELRNSIILSHWGFADPDPVEPDVKNWTTYTPTFRPEKDIVIPNNGANFGPYFPKPAVKL